MTEHIEAFKAASKDKEGVALVAAIESSIIAATQLYVGRDGNKDDAFALIQEIIDHIVLLSLLYKVCKCNDTVDPMNQIGKLEFTKFVKEAINPEYNLSSKDKKVRDASLMMPLINLYKMAAENIGVDQEKQGQTISEIQAAVDEAALLYNR